ncbi:MAG: S-layer homology domain-containing protein [Firmicutes bacterium]|nr:S-layer homology domain-containing protein [Bacillota bacterium]
MKRKVDRAISFLLSVVLIIQVMPLTVLAATDNLLRFRIGMTDENSYHVITAEYDGTAYVMGGILEDKGRRAFAANDTFTSIIDYGDGYTESRSYVEISQSKGASQFGLQWNRETFSIALSEPGNVWLHVQDGILTTSQPGDAPIYWNTGWFDENDQWVSGLYSSGAEEGQNTYIVLKVDDGEPYFTAVTALDSSTIPTEIAVENCSHPTLVHYDGTAATCTEPGTKEYWFCSLCEAASRSYKFFDERGTIEFWDDSARTIPALGHVDNNTDGVCDRCGLGMPIFTRVTEVSEIQGDCSYLLGTEIRGNLYLAMPPSDMDMSLLPATAAVDVDDDGAIPYSDMKESGSMMIRLKAAAENADLDEGEYRYTIVSTGGGASGALECMWGDFYLSPDENSKYGWRVSLNDDQTNSALITPVEFMPPEEFDSIHAYAIDDKIGFSLRTGDMESNRHPDAVSVMQYPVYLYVMSGQEKAEAWEYELEDETSRVDYSLCEELDNYSTGTAIRANVSGLADSLTEKAIQDLVAQYRIDTDHKATSYNITARTDIEVSDYDSDNEESGTTMYLDFSHVVTITGEGQESISYPVTESQLGADKHFDLTLYSPFHASQLVRDDGITYRDEDHKMVAVYQIAKPYQRLASTFYLYSFTSEVFFDQIRFNEIAIMENHEHQWDNYHYNADGEWYTCQVCDEDWKVRDHTYTRFEEDTFDEFGVAYTIDPTLESPGTAEIYCETCEYVKEQPIDPTDNWAWIVLTDEDGNPLPDGCIKNVDWRYKGVIYNETYEDVGADCLAWHFDERKSQEWAADQPLRCQIFFTEAARQLYIVPWSATYENLEMGKPLKLTLRNRENAAISITGQLAEDLRGYSSLDVSIRVRTELEGGGVLKNLEPSSDGTFRTTVPYGPTNVVVDIRERGSVTFRDVQILKPNEQGDIDLGIVEIPNRNGQEVFYTEVYPNSNAEAADAARWLGENGEFVLINEETGIICDTEVFLPNDQPADGVRFAITAKNPFIVGDTLRLECLTDNSLYKADAFTFTLQERGVGETVLDLTIHKCGSVTPAFVSNVGSYWCILFDSQGNLINENFRTETHLPQGNYTYIAYAKNPYIGRVDHPDALEMLEVPEYLYLRETFTVYWGDEIQLTGTIPEFSPTVNLAVQATVDSSRQTGELVPVYITYKGFADLADQGLTFKLFSTHTEYSGSNLPLVKVNGRYATWDGDPERLTEEVRMSDGSWRVYELSITAHENEGTICVYARPDGETLYIVSPNGSTAIQLPRKQIVVTTPEPVTSSYQGNFIYYAKLPAEDAPYEAVLYVDGEPMDPKPVNLNGRGANEIPYAFVSQSDASIHELWLDIRRTTEDEVTGEEIAESVWQSDVYPVMYNSSLAFASPYKLSIRVGVNCYNMDLNKSYSPQIRLTFVPSDFNPDNTINRDIVFDYQLYVHGADQIENGQVLLRVYCGEKEQTPTIHNVLLNYNEETNTFDGTLTLKANTFNASQLPYGYSFSYDTSSPERTDVSLMQIGEKIKAQEAARTELEPYEIPEIVDMDTMEFILANSPEFSETEKQVLRILGASQNELHDIYTEFRDALNAIHVEGLDMTVSEAASLSDFMKMNPEYQAEYLKEGISEAQLIENYGYYCVDTESERFYLRYGENYNSVILWNQGIHLWEGFTSPLPEGEPLTGEETLFSMRNLAPVLMTAPARRSVADPISEMIQDALSTSSLSIYITNTFLAGFLDPLLNVIQKLATHIEKTMAELYRAMSPLGLENTKEMKEFLLREARASVQKYNAKLMADLPGNVALKPDFLISTEIPQELRSMVAKVNSLKKEIAALNVDIEELNDATNQTFRSAIAKVKNSTSSVTAGCGKIKRFMEGKGGKVLGGALGIASIFAGYISMLQSMNAYMTEVENAAIELDYGMSLVNKCLEDAEDDCTEDQVDAMEEVEECVEAFENLETQVNDIVFWYGTAYVAKAALWLPNAITTVSGMFVKNPYLALADLSIGALTNVSEATAMAAALWNTHSLKRAENKMIKQCEGPLPFEKSDACEDKVEKNPPRPVSPPNPDFNDPVTPIIDPAGYVYEAVASNRLDGVTATVWYKGTNGQPVRWDEAPEFDEVNPQITSADGKYAWMTPIGNWLVTVNKDGYYDADSKNDPAAVDGWLPVPPPQLDVNIPMVSKSAPAVESAIVASDRAQIVFSQYMDIAQITEGGFVSITQNGASIPVNLSFSDREESPANPGTFYGRILELTRTDGEAFSGNGITITVSGTVRNYAGTALGRGYSSGALSVVQIPGFVDHSYPNRYVTDVGKTEEIVVLVRDTNGLPMADTLVTADNASAGTLTITSSAVTDADGRALFEIKGITSGDGSILFTAGAVGTEMNTRVSSIGTEAPAKPTANLTDYQTVEADTELILYCETEGAVIFYTTDNTCPCEEGESQHLYTQPVPVTETTLFRIASYTETGGYSERLNLHILVEAEDVHLCKDNLTHMEPKPASCTVDGNIEYYTCSCGKWYSDADASVEITDRESVVIEGGHNYGTLIEEVPAVHTANELKAGMKAHYFCDKCSKYFTAEKVETDEGALVIPAPDHEYTTVNGYKEADGHADTCSCGAHNSVVGHSPDIPAATETQDQKCSVCGYVMESAIEKTSYVVTVAGSYASTNGAGEYEAGETVTIYAGSRSGYRFNGWISSDVTIAYVNSTTATFVMPDKAVTVTASWTKLSSGGGGSHVSNEEDTTMMNAFEDVSADAYYYDAVLWAVKEGITKGTGATTFSPDRPCTRAQMATFLWNAAGSPEPVNKTCIFDDVPANSYYAKAVQWVYEQGITSGTGASTYSPDEACTRGQMATFLCRMADGKPVDDNVIFTDVKDRYYEKSVQWAYEQKITAGTSTTTFSPDHPCTRAQMVTFLYRYFVK